MNTENVQEGEETGREDAVSEPKKRKKEARSLVGESYGEAFKKLTVSEQRFVRLLVKGLDVNKSLVGRAKREAYDMLGRARVRSAILAVAPFTDSNVSVNLVRPYVIQRLISGAIEGDVSAARVLLSIEAKQPNATPDYSRSPTRNPTQ